MGCKVTEKILDWGDFNSGDYLNLITIFIQRAFVKENQCQPLVDRFPFTVCPMDSQPVQLH